MGTDQSQSSTRTFVGNGQKIDLSTNRGVLRIVGNNCSVTISNNEGQIFITGNKGYLKVMENTGFIGYTGNNGLIHVSRTSKGIGQVVYTGNGGVIKQIKPKFMTNLCSLKRNNSKTKLKQETEHTSKTCVCSSLKVNGVERCFCQKSTRNHHVINQNHSLRNKVTPATSVNCSQEARKVWCKVEKSIGKEKVSTINMLRQKNFEPANIRNLGLENWCINMATELVVL